MSAEEVKVYRVEFNSALARYLVMGAKGLVAQCVYCIDADKICDALNNYDSLKADLERMVKMYGDKENYATNYGTMYKDILPIKDSEKLDDYYYAGKLAREIGEKWKISYE